jgi:hypothetical protein
VRQGCQNADSNREMTGVVAAEARRNLQRGEDRPSRRHGRTDKSRTGKSGTRTGSTERGGLSAQRPVRGLFVSCGLRALRRGGGSQATSIKSSWAQPGNDLPSAEHQETTASAGLEGNDVPLGPGGAPYRGRRDTVRGLRRRRHASRILSCRVFADGKPVGTAAFSVTARWIVTAVCRKDRRVVLSIRAIGMV